jgi:hypothetical protein
MQPSSPFPFLDSPLLWALLLGTLLASCGGGGGSGGGGDPGPGLNEGSYSIDDFNYVDEHPPGFQPLGEDGYQVLARDELLTILPAQTGQGFPGLARSYQLQEGPDAGYAPILDFGALFPGEDVWAAAAGQLDDDPNRELVVATRTTSRIGIEVVQRMPTGAYERTPVVSIPSPGWSFADVRVTLGNLDADLRDEILVVARSAPFTEPASRGRVWVFDDPEAGAAPLMSFERTAGHADLQALPIDVDGDGTKEVLVGMSGDTTDDGRTAQHR